MNTRKLELWILLADLSWIGGAFLAAGLLRFGLTWTPDERASIHALLPFVSATSIIWTALSAFMPMDGFRGGWRLPAVLSHLLLGTVCTMGVLLTLGYLTRSYVSRLALAYFIVLLFGGFLGIRSGARLVLQRRHQEGDVWRVVVLGSGRIAQEVASKIRQHPETLCRVVGLLFPNQDAEELLTPGLAYDHAAQVSTFGIFDLLRSARVNEVIVALPHPPSIEIRTLIARIRDLGIQTSLVPSSYELYAAKTRLISLDGLPLVQLREPGLRRRYLVLKRVLDLAVSAVLIAPAFLVLLPCALALLLKRRVPFRWETRCGEHGLPFRMLRLNVDRPVRTKSRVERWLEHMSITELPQLWNVLRGQMSLVGPRPDPPARRGQYSEWQQRRLRVKPGMTGLAQVHGLRESSSAEQKTRFDLQYVMDPYLLLDISLLLQTIWTLVQRVFSPIPGPQVYGLEWGPGTSAREDVIAHAHRTQSSSD
ncbi:MAG TPA: sugar transferase [Terriglobales bacterium]|nr:sugar transferase [Terriglobales bacterium]